jgi:stearoyl-CoA desaturase (delta-9 desaturase)
MLGPKAGFDTWMATSFLVWGVFGRYCFTQFSHSMVDTISHGVGLFKKLPDTCNTGTSAKNNVIYWLCTFGNETWHNIHHAFPRAANNGSKWYRWDFDSFFMWSMQKLGVISGCKFLTEAEINKRMVSKEKAAY